MVPFGVDIGIDPVGDLQGEAGQAHRGVVGAGGEPVHLLAPGQPPTLRAPPEAHVMPFGRVTGHFLLIGERLALFEDEQGAHRGVRIAAAQHRGHHHPAAGLEVDLVGAVPAGPEHRRVQLLHIATETQVHRVSEQSLAGARAADEVVRHVHPSEQGVQPGQQQIGDDQPEREERPQVPPARGDELVDEQEREPAGSKRCQDEEDLVGEPDRVLVHHLDSSMRALGERTGHAPTVTSRPHRTGHPFDMMERL